MNYIVNTLVIGLLLHSIGYAASSSSAEIDAPPATALQPKGLLLSKMEKKEQISLDELHDYIKKASLQFIAEFSEIIKNRASLKDLLESFDKEDAHKRSLKFDFGQENTIPQWFLAAFSFYLIGQYDQGIRASYNIIPWLSNEKRINKTVRIEFSNLTETLLAWCCLERAYKTGAPYDYLMAARIYERLRQEDTSNLIYQGFGLLYEEKATSISNCLLKVFWWKRSADAYRKAKMDDKAKQCYLEIAKGYQEDAASSFKNNHISYKLIAEAYAAAGQDELAKLFYEKVLKKFSKLTKPEKNPPYVLNAAAEVYQGLGQHEQAVHYS